MVTFTCLECPDRTWSSRHRAKEHNHTHTIQRNYQAPRQLADKVPLLSHWVQITLPATVILRRFNATPIDPVVMVTNPKDGPEIKDTPPQQMEEEAEAVDDRLGELDASWVDDIWHNEEMQGILEELVEEEPYPQPQPVETATPHVTSLAAVIGYVTAARRDVETMRAMADSADRFLDSALTYLAMEGCTDPQEVFNPW